MSSNISIFRPLFGFVLLAFATSQVAAQSSQTAHINSSHQQPVVDTEYHAIGGKEVNTHYVLVYSVSYSGKVYEIVDGQGSWYAYDRPEVGKDYQVDKVTKRNFVMILSGKKARNKPAALLKVKFAITGVSEQQATKVKGVSFSVSEPARTNDKSIRFRYIQIPGRAYL
jgi:hypothetical protein